MEAPKCLRCGSSMSPGFLKDVRHGTGYGDLLRWLGGAPRNTFWTGVKGAEDKASLPVGGFRCEECGWLDLYAGSRFEAQ